MQSNFARTTLNLLNIDILECIIAKFSVVLTFWEKKKKTKNSVWHQDFVNFRNKTPTKDKITHIFEKLFQNYGFQSFMYQYE